jgi:predicted lipid-binding transport protein (Tim44 family)
MKLSRKHIFTFLIISGLIIAALMFFCDESFARPGGGHGFRGGGGGYHGGGFHGGGLRSGGHYTGGFFVGFTGNFGMDFLINIIGWAVIIYLLKKFLGGDKSTDSVSSMATSDNLAAQASAFNSSLRLLINGDNNFSVPVFLDYVTMLFNKLYLTYNTKDFQEITPFLAGTVPNLGEGQNSEIAIGNVEISKIKFQRNFTVITVSFTANYTNTNPKNGKSFRYEIEEEWVMKRKANSLSPKPEGFGVLRCPNCGGTLDFKDFGKCQHCGSTLNFNTGGWMISRIVRQKTEKYYTENMLTYTEEEGTYYDTIFSNTLTSDEKTFKDLHKNFKDFSGFEDQIAKPYFLEIYKNWSDNTCDKTRHLLSERQWQNFNAYLKQLQSLGYQNKVENVKITNIETVKYDIDFNYESITVRIFARCLDYIANSDGKIIAGDSKNPRQFSEYWTFVANRNARFKNTDLHSCPNCGAPVEKIGESGVCEYCNSKITDGNFSWILFSITQDEVYTG